MITESDLRQAIAECQGERNPNANTCIKLASYLTIQDHMYGSPDVPSFTAAPEIQPSEGITFRSDTEFSRAVSGKDSSTVMEVMDELMSALQVLSPRLYNLTMNKVRKA